MARSTLDTSLAPTQVRQGDVMLVPATVTLLTTMPKTAIVPPENGRVILAYGEVTGHHHSLSAETSTLYRVEDRGMMLEVREPSILEHQEHGPINVAPGVYWVVRQREYTPGAVRRVFD